jgi:hypothetical protein
MVLKLRKFSFAIRRNKHIKPKNEWETAQHRILHDKKAMASMLETMMMSDSDEPDPSSGGKVLDARPTILPSNSDVSSLALTSPTDTRPAAQRRWGRAKNPTSASEHFWSTKIEPKLLEKSVKIGEDSNAKAHRRAVAVARSMFNTVWDRQGIPMA